MIETGIIITSKDLAFGIGRPLTDNEWHQYFESNPNDLTPINTQDVRAFLKNKLS